MSDRFQMRRGQITRISRSGVGYITTIDRSDSRSEFVFPFSKIRRRANGTYVSYRGESPKDLGFREGVRVMFSQTPDGLIDTIEVAS